MEKFDLNSYLKGKTETTELIKDQLEFTLKCGNVSELDIKRMIKLCDSLIEAYKIKTMKTIELECRECNGTGYYEHSFCFKPASECCGGCTRFVQCDCDNGIKYYEVDERMCMLYEYFTENNFEQHQKIVSMLESVIVKNDR